MFFLSKFDMNRFFGMDDKVDEIPKSGLHCSLFNLFPVCDVYRSGSSEASGWNRQSCLFFAELTEKYFSLSIDFWFTNKFEPQNWFAFVGKSFVSAYWAQKEQGSHMSICCLPHSQTPFGSATFTQVMATRVWIWTDN